MSKAAEVASYCDHTFEAAQRALSAGEIETFKRFAAAHRGLVELHHHLYNGGSIH